MGASLVFISVPPSCDRGHVYLASGVAMGGSVGGENRVLGVVGKPDMKADEWLQGGGGAAWRRVVIPPSLKAVARARLDEVRVCDSGGRQNCACGIVILPCMTRDRRFGFSFCNARADVLVEACESSGEGAIPSSQTPLTFSAPLRSPLPLFAHPTDTCCCRWGSQREARAVASKGLQSSSEGRTAQ
jgi:hypothetical protein